jgi:RimJ/RimL family protein N-acetyltransferase
MTLDMRRLSLLAPVSGALDDGRVTPTLEPLRDEDSEALFAWINDRELVERSAVFRPITRDEHDAWFDEVRERDDVAIFAIREQGRLIGSCQLLVAGDEAELRVRIAYPDAQGRGVGTWAVRELVAHGFDELGLRRIWLQVFAVNARAIRAYEKAGFATVRTGPTLIMERVAGWD